MSSGGAVVTGGVVLLAGAMAVPGGEAEGRFVNAIVDARPAGDLAAVVTSVEAAAAGPEWIAYAVPAADDHASGCGCWESGGRLMSPCPLEDGGGGFFRSTPHAASESVPLEGPRRIVVLLRVAHGAVGRIRVFDGSCRLDAGGRPVHWLSGVDENQSLSLLARYVEPWPGEDHDRLASTALMAIALHAAARADAVLERYAAAGKLLDLRKQAAFWMGVARGRRGFEDLRRLALGGAGAGLREHVTFALAQSREPEAVDTIIRMARKDASPRVRGQALFWLAQKAGRQAAAVISDAIEEDPETEVKTKAVFALSQLPPDEGVPLLIEQARTNRNREVRKQALFWLGQSDDARALALFEEILGR